MMASVGRRIKTSLFGAILLHGCLYSPRNSRVETVVIRGTRDVDILFVIDNTGSMADEQSLLSSNFGAFIDVLEAEDVNANYRIGITTADSGNPRCGVAEFSPENGTLVLSSCLDRVDAGEFHLPAQGLDFSGACTEFCAQSDSSLTVLPTTTQYDSMPRPRRWIERLEGVSNIVGVASNVEAFRCYGPQGVGGCGFESHLESMYQALVKSSDKNSPNFGFLRDSAILAIVVITDELDCSYQEAQKEVFTTNKTFWDPSDPTSTSAVCWRAGVECSGSSPYSECHAADYGVDGTIGVAAKDAVLRPVREYIDYVKEIETAKRASDDNQRVLVSLIAGVPVGYETRSAEITYADSPDERYQKDFGIGTGCEYEPMGVGAAQVAVPPVRLREFAEAFHDPNAATRNIYSICQNDYSAALDAIAARIRKQLEPSCMPMCVLDTDPDTWTIEPNCRVFEDARGIRVELPQCIDIGGVWSVPAGATVCYAMRTDPQGATASALDDMSSLCVERGSNLEFVILRSVAAAEGAVISAQCEISDDSVRDCPLL